MTDALTLAPWLDEVRAEAATQYAVTDVPTDDEEVWRYSRINSIEFDRYTPSPSTTTVEPMGVDGAAATVVLRDGRVDELTRTDALGAATVQTISEHPAGPEIINRVRGAGTDAIAHLHDANLADVIVVDVPRGVEVTAPIVIDTYADAETGLTCPHTIVRAANGAKVTVLERRRSGDHDQLVVPVVELDAAPDARIGYLVIQQLGRSTVSLEHHASNADQQAHVVSSVAAFGGSYARTRADFRLVGRGASGDLLSAYFGDGSQMLDFRTFQEHAAPDTTSNLLFKGAVTGDAQSVYTGLIRVAESAPGTNAYQTNRNLKLSEGAWAYSVPNLEIEQKSGGVQPRVDRRGDRRRAALLPRESRRSDDDRRTVARVGFLRRGHRPVPRRCGEGRASGNHRRSVGSRSSGGGGCMSTDSTSASVKLCDLDGLASGDVASVDVNGTEIAYARVGDQWFAIDAICSHAKVSLADGLVDKDDLTIECPKHGALFSLESGDALTLPAIKPVLTHEVTVEGTEVYVTVTSEQSAKANEAES